MDAHGRIDVLLNNAGGSRAKSLDTWALADFNDMVALNLTSVWVLSLAASRHMRTTGGGAIVNISSMASLRPPHLGISLLGELPSAAPSVKEQAPAL